MIIKLGQVESKVIWIVKHLKQWFKLVDDKDYELYYKKLEDLLLLYDKKPNKKLQIYYKK